MKKAKDYESLERFYEIKLKLTRYADDHLALRGYQEYIMANLGAALDVVRNGDTMYALDDRVLLKQALGITIPASLSHDLHMMTEDPFTELEMSDLRDLFIRYAAGLPDTKKARHGAECGVLRILTPLGALKASFDGLRNIKVVLEDEGRDVALVSADKALIYNSGICRENVAFIYDCKAWENTDYITYRNRCNELFAETEENTPEAYKNSPEMRKAKERLIKSVLPAKYLDGLDMEELLRFTGEAYDVFGHGGSYADLCKVIALEEMLAMDVPYWMYLALMACSDGVDPVTAEPADVRFEQFAGMVMNEQAPGEATAVLSDFKNRCVLANVPVSAEGDRPYGASGWQVLSFYASPDTYNPGIYIDRIIADDEGLYSVPMALIEYTEDEFDSLDSCNGIIVSRIWSNPNRESYTHRFVYRRKGSVKSFEEGNVLLIPGLHTGDYTVKVLMRKNNVLYCKETAYQDSQPNQYRIETDPKTGCERFLAWEYNGSKCYVYPDNSPENVYNGSATHAED